MSLSKAEKTVIRAFRKRWLNLKNKSLMNTLQEYRSSVACWFEAAEKKDCFLLARKYYGIDHIEKMCELSDEQVLFNLNPICRYLDAHFDDEDCPTAKDLLSAEYILFEFSSADYPNKIEPSDIYLGTSFGSNDDDAEERTIDLSLLDVGAYRSAALYDDWYERVGGFNTFFLGILMKSTGELFSKKETRMLTESVVHNVTSNDIEELWVFEVAHHGNQIVVSIDTHTPDNYVAPIKTAITEMSSEDVIAMVKNVLRMKDNEKEELSSDFLKAVYACSKQQQPGIELFKKKLIYLMEKQNSNDGIRRFEEALSKFLFGGQPYYHLDCTPPIGQNMLE